MSVDLRFTFSDKARVAALVLTNMGPDAYEYPGHGAPHGIVIERGNLAEPIYWDMMHFMTDALNMTPDSVNLRPSEITSHALFRSFSVANELWDFPNTRGRHILFGGDNGCIDGVRKEDIAVVADKTLREMRAWKMIMADDYERTLGHMARHDLIPSVYKGRLGEADPTASPKINYYGHFPVHETCTFLGVPAPAR